MNRPRRVSAARPLCVPGGVPRAVGVMLAFITIVVVTACGAVRSGRITAPRAPRLARWSRFSSVRRPVDLAGPRRDGSLVVAADTRLSLVSPNGAVTPFPSATGGYRSPGGEEPYIALSPGGCYGNGTVYALRLTHGRGVVAIGTTGSVRRFARLRVPGLLDGITFDHTGGFGHRLLVTSNAGAATAVEAIDCHGAATTITRSAPRIEGGIAVAPTGFGLFAGDLIAPSETSGQVYAVTPSGRSELLARSLLPRGADVGVESEGFVPRDPSADAFLADRFTAGNRHPGDDVLLRIGAAALRAAGVRPGELLVSTEASGLTDAIRCSAAGCRVRLVAEGPAIAHGEGHITFAVIR
jgi:hypothetical protein